MNTYKWSQASLSLTPAWSALGNPMGVERSATATTGSDKKRRPAGSRFEEAARAPAGIARDESVHRDDERCPIWYASRHAENGHVVLPGHNEGLETRYGGEVPV
jgi:hypothetical protein